LAGAGVTTRDAAIAGPVRARGLSRDSAL